MALLTVHIVRTCQLRSRLTFFHKSKDMSCIPHHSIPEVAEVPHETESWGSNSECEAMASEQADFPLSLSPSPKCSTRAGSPVEFMRRDLCYVSFGLDDILFTTASDSEDYGTSVADALPLCGQEAQPLVAYTELTYVCSHTVEKLNLDWPEHVQ